MPSNRLRPWRRAIASGVAAVLALVLATTAPGMATADEQAEIDRKVEDASDALEDANAEVRAAAAALAEARELLPPAQARLDEAVAREAAARQAYEDATAEHERAVAEFEAAEQRLEQIESQYENLRSDVGDFARRAYQMGPFAEMEMVLNAEDPIEFTDRLAAIQAVSKANNAALGDMAANRADQSYTEMRMEALEELAAEQKALAEEKLQEAESARLEAEAAKALIDELVAQRDAALQVADSQRTAVQSQYAALQAEQARIARAAQEAAEALRRQLAAAASSGSSGTSGSSWSSADGFEWPIAGGGVTQFAGPRIHPVYGYRSCHTGVDVRGGSGTPIRAVQSGVVASIENGGPYGLHTLIAHGDGVASMYAHQSRTSVRAGQQVAKGDVIGYVGSTGWVTGPHLHFEIHVGGVPFDPMGWYGQSKSAIRC